MAEWLNVLQNRYVETAYKAKFLSCNSLLSRIYSLQEPSKSDGYLVSRINTLKYL